MNFPQANFMLLGTDIEDCGDLRCFRTEDGVFTSKWRMSWRERFSAFLFGAVWVHVHGGKTSPPIALDVRKDVFE
ncbi:MAG: hypothetical protein KAJ01_09395 [Candidatus Hydrogenedentes bacterium]|nr:hypothetical protein [Candidatus Hydrogenedentota bacterium]